MKTRPFLHGILAVLFVLAIASALACKQPDSPKPIAVTGVTLDETELILIPGEWAPLIATIEPPNAKNKNVTWVSSNPDVAIVEDGEVTAIEEGTTNIIVTTVDGGRIAICTVTVTPECDCDDAGNNCICDDNCRCANCVTIPGAISVTDVTLDKQALNMGVGSEETLIHTVSPPNAANKNVTWTSSDTDVAVVEDGVVTALAAGTATITVTTADGGHTATCTVNAIWRLTSIEGVKDYIQEQIDNNPPDPDEPICLPLQLDLGVMTDADSGWRELLNAVYQASLSNLMYYNSLFFELDLRACTIGGTSPTTFDPDSSLSAIVKGKIVSIILPDTATSIRDGTSEDSTFRHFTKLKSVSGANIKAIGEYVFRIYDGLTDADFTLIEVDFPAAESIGLAAFRTCRNLSKVNFPSATLIGSYAFMDCDSLETVSFPKVTNVQSNAFRNCRKLKEADIPALTKIDSDAFYGCAALASANFPLVTGIGANAFYNCGSLASASFPAVTGIGESAFQGCEKLASASFPAATGIGAHAFRGCEKLASANLPAAGSIGEYAFFGCAALAEADFPGVSSLAIYAFGDCTSLAGVNFPSVYSIGISAFENCSSLTSVDFPGAASIGSGAFSGCSKLISASFPSVSSIVRNAFQNTGTSNILISLGSVAPELGETIFSDVTRTVNVSIPAGASGYSPDWISGLRGRGYISDSFVGAIVRANITVQVRTDDQPVVVLGALTLPFLRNGSPLGLVPPAISSNGVTIAGQGWETSDDGTSGWTVFTPATATTTLDGKSLRYYVTAGSSTWYSNAVVIKVWSANAREVTVNMWDKPGDGWEGEGALKISVKGTAPNAEPVGHNAKAVGHNTVYYFAVEPNDTVTFSWIEGLNQVENAFAVYYRDNPPDPAFDPDPNKWEEADDPAPHKVLLYKQYGSMKEIANDEDLGSFTAAAQ